MGDCVDAAGLLGGRPGQQRSDRKMGGGGYGGLGERCRPRREGGRAYVSLMNRPGEDKESAPLRPRPVCLDLRAVLAVLDFLAAWQPCSAFLCPSKANIFALLQFYFVNQFFVLELRTSKNRMERMLSTLQQLNKEVS